MDVSSQLHVPAALPPRKIPRYPIGKRLEKAKIWYLPRKWWKQWINVSSSSHRESMIMWPCEHMYEYTTWTYVCVSGKGNMSVSGIMDAEMVSKYGFSRRIWKEMSVASFKVTMTRPFLHTPILVGNYQYFRETETGEGGRKSSIIIVYTW
jgi:hypothetical protein